ncbi:MAG: GNAT family N-acetyltransferase [Chloroflexota bacterium]
MPAVPALPSAVPGAAWRPLSQDDVEPYVALLEAARVADGGEEVMTAEVARRELADPHCPPATNTLALALDDGTLGGVAAVYERFSGEEARRAFLFGTVRPDLRDRGVGRGLVAWAVARADEALAGQPESLERLVEVFLDERLTPAIHLFERMGFERVRWYMDMRRDLHEPIPELALPPGIRLETCRTELSEALRAVHNEAFADHWGSMPLTEDVWTLDFLGDPRFRSDLTFIAFDGEEIAGQSLNYVAEDDWAATGIREGWIGQLSVRRPWRKQGLATALLVRSMQAFLDAGLDGAALGVDAENPSGAVGIYERLGFRPTHRSVRLQRPFSCSAG